MQNEVKSIHQQYVTRSTWGNYGINNDKCHVYSNLQNERVVQLKESTEYAMSSDATTYAGETPQIEIFSSATNTWIQTEKMSVGFFYKNRLLYQQNLVNDFFTLIFDATNFSCSQLFLSPLKINDVKLNVPGTM